MYTTLTPIQLPTDPRRKPLRDPMCLPICALFVLKFCFYSQDICDLRSAARKRFLIAGMDALLIADSAGLRR